MKIAVQLRLLPSPVQAAKLLATMKAFNAAASYAARVGFDAKVFSPPAIQKLCYYELRKRFDLPAQLAVRAIGKAAEVFRRDKAKCPEFKPTGAIQYDQRNSSLKGVERASLSTLTGREVMPIVFGEYQRGRMAALCGQKDLVYRGGKFYLIVVTDLPEDPAIVATEFIGVDLGIVVIAATSDGESFSGKATDAVREKFARTRKRLQRKGTRGSKKILKRIRRRETNFRRWVNHGISKAIVANAKRTGRAIAVEDLHGIRERVTVRKKQRSRHHGWAFLQLRTFIEYKAKIAGVPVVAVDPRYSSRTCAECGHCDKANRKSQGDFLCLSCGHAANADHNAARVLSARAWGACKPPSELPALAGQAESGRL